MKVIFFQNLRVIIRKIEIGYIFSKFLEDKMEKKMNLNKGRKEKTITRMTNWKNGIRGQE